MGVGGHVGRVVGSAQHCRAQGAGRHEGGRAILERTACAAAVEVLRRGYELRAARAGDLRQNCLWVYKPFAVEGMNAAMVMRVRVMPPGAAGQYCGPHGPGMR
jgi:hypothetical protein